MKQITEPCQGMCLSIQRWKAYEEGDETRQEWQALETMMKILRMAFMGSEKNDCNDISTSFRTNLRYITSALALARAYNQRRGSLQVASQFGVGNYVCW